MTVAERRRYIPLARKDKDARIVVYCFAPDLEGCLARNEKRTGRAHVPEVAIKCKLAKFEPPDFGEGIDEIYYVKVFENDFDVRRRNEKE